MLNRREQFYDPKCGELALLFLKEDHLDSKENVDFLADAIQTVIEDNLAALLVAEKRRGETK